jgi:hypothetical protein
VKRVEDIVKMGDMIWVKVLGVDERGKIKLSRKAAMKERDEAAGNDGARPTACRRELRAARNRIQDPVAFTGSGVFFFVEAPRRVRPATSVPFSPGKVPGQAPEAPSRRHAQMGAAVALQKKTCPGF